MITSSSQSSSTNSSPPVRLIVTHPGGSHKDEFLACCVLIHRHQVPIERREPTAEDLADRSVVVVDVGGEHEPSRGNFDHHQFPRDHEPCCALTLVLQDMGIYDSARNFCDWLETAEWFDCRGPVDTAKHLGVDLSLVHKLASPIDLSLLRRFASTHNVGPSDALWQIMGMVGEDLVGYIEGLAHRLREVAGQAEWWTVEGPEGPIEVLAMPRTDPPPHEPSSGLARFIEQEGKADSVVAMIYPDRRGKGFALARYNDKPGLDFSRLESLDDVHFAHARGFVAKTSATDPERLRELLSLAQVGA